ncbi:MAG: helix-hairpin-helix domain-containing protein [Bdellovibrionota bacterium]
MGSPEYRILTQLRDEAHRFAITHHRKRRKKVLHTSILDQVPGLGPSLKKKLYEKFVDLQGMKVASIDELAEIKGLSRRTAIDLYSVLQSLDL